MECSLILYNDEFCPECRVVREKLAELGLTYVCINVSPSKAERAEVERLTGQRAVPVLMDGNTVLTTHDNIVEYLLRQYGHESLRPVRY